MKTFIAFIAMKIFVFFFFFSPSKSAPASALALSPTNKCYWKKLITIAIILFITPSSKPYLLKKKKKHTKTRVLQVMARQGFSGTVAEFYNHLKEDPQFHKNSAVRTIKRPNSKHKKEEKKEKSMCVCVGGGGGRSGGRRRKLVMTVVRTKFLINFEKRNVRDLSLNHIMFYCVAVHCIAFSS